MLLPFSCEKCRADKWMIRYSTDEKVHEIECVSCGYRKILEEIFSGKRKRDNFKQPKVKLVPDTNAQVQTKAINSQIQKLD